MLTATPFPLLVLTSLGGLQGSGPALIHILLQPQVQTHICTKEINPGSVGALTRERGTAAAGAPFSKGEWSLGRQ